MIITGDFQNKTKRQSDDLSPCSVVVKISSGGILRHSVPSVERPGTTETVDFVIDLDSVLYNKSLMIDYDHDTKEILGYCEDIRRDDEGNLVATGILIPFSKGDRAGEVAYKSQFVPLGVSPTVDFEQADRIDLAENETMTVNETLLTGPLVVYRNTPILGVSICPYPTDSDTSVQLLKKQFSEKGTKMAEESIVVAEEPVVESASVRDEELQKYIDKFGLEAGVRFFQEGKTFEEAMSERFDELNAQYSKLSEERKPDEEKKTELEDEAVPEEKDKEEKETTTLNKEIKTLRQSMTELSRNVNKMSVMFTKLSGEAAPVSGSYHPKSESFTEAFTKRFKSN